ncbi:MAG: hypothetical protein IMY80_08435 [Chloroflexi bacterium]|nr:hypothetical protein [Chloroflexota bacterium]
MNTTKPYKQRILDLLEMVGAEGADNAKIRKETGIPSHQQVYLLTQELTMRGEITARRKGRNWVFYPLDAPSPGAFRGHWRVISSPDFDRETLGMETIPFVRVEGDKFEFEGTFHIGLIQGEFDGRLDGKRVLFSFKAADELEPVHGAGTMSLLDRQMEFRLMFFLGDEFTFICERS